MLSVLTINLEMNFFMFLHHVNWVYISSVIRMCVCVCGVVLRVRELSLGFWQCMRLFWRFYLLLLDRLTQQGVESPLDFSVCLGNCSED